MKRTGFFLFVVISYFFILLQDSTATGTIRKKSAQPGESYRSLTRNGAWCWFSDPRAVFHEGKKRAVYAGWVNGFGDIVVGSIDLTTMKIDTAVLHIKLEADDHTNPSILIRHDGRVFVFYSRHSRRGGPLTMRVSARPEDVSEWLPERNLEDLNEGPAFPPGARRDFCYSNPVQLSAENHRIFLFWRGVDFKPCFSISPDGGETWQPGRILIMPENTYRERRPYFKIASNGVDRIHIAFTDGHPRDEPENGIRYMCYRNGGFYRADGTRIADMASLPVRPDRADLVYDARRTKARSWIWDVAEDKRGRPVIVYARFPFENDHRYCYAAWDGAAWRDHEMVPAAPWFPKTPRGEKESEPHYSGGLVLDHSNPSVVYLSRLVDGVFEIEKWDTKNMGRTWKTESITSGSQNNNVRPFAVLHLDSDEGKGLVRGDMDHGPAAPSVLWLNIRRYTHYTDYDASIKMDIPIELDPPAVP